MNKSQAVTPVTRKSLDEMGFIEVGELVIKAAGAWRGAAIIELVQEQYESWDYAKEYLVNALNALWWGESAEDIIEDLLQGIRYLDNDEIPF
jgi:hypothetical protein